MERSTFYDSKRYRELQRERSLKAWSIRKKSFQYKRETRVCVGENCGAKFNVVPSEQKRFCSQSCSTRSINRGRTHSEETRGKISKSLTGKPNPYKGVQKVKRVKSKCPRCGEIFRYERWKQRQYCSAACAIRSVGSRTTSPRAARGKSGVRRDISGGIVFFSRWEANMARLYNYLGIQWEYAPKQFDIGGQNYRPDFFLPKSNEYVEVKNYLNPYSKERDKKFRERYPDIKLTLLLREDYLKLERKYAKHISAWEYRNSPVPDDCK